MNDCIFCKIISNEIPSHKVWENETHVAILDIFPSVKGQTLVLPKEHVDSNPFGENEDQVINVYKAARIVAGKLTHVLNAKRVCLVFEGLEVSHLHAKLYPVGVDNEPMRLSIAAGPREEDSVLDTLAAKILAS